MLLLIFVVVLFPPPVFVPFHFLLSGAHTNKATIGEWVWLLELRPSRLQGCEKGLQPKRALELLCEMRDDHRPRLFSPLCCFFLLCTREENGSSSFLPERALEFSQSPRDERLQVQRGDLVASLEKGGSQPPRLVLFSKMTKQRAARFYTTTESEECSGNAWETVARVRETVLTEKRQKDIFWVTGTFGARPL